MQARRSGAMWPSRASGQRRRICVEIYESSFADSTNKKQVHPELKCDSEEQQDHECVTKLGVLHRQAKQTLLDEMLEQFTAPPPLLALPSLPTLLKLLCCSFIFIH